MTKEERLIKTIKKIAENYEQLEQSLVAQLKLETPNHQYTTGAYRERVWKSLSMLFPHRAYANMFTGILEGPLPEEGESK